MQYNSNGSPFQELKYQFNTVESNATKIVSGLSSLTEAHLDLLKEEMTEQRDRSLNAVALLGLSAIAALIGLVFGSIFAAEFLTEHVASLTLADSLGIVGIVWLIAAAAFVFTGIKLFKKTALVPNATINSFKESIKCLIN